MCLSQLGDFPRSIFQLALYSFRTSRLSLRQELLTKPWVSNLPISATFRASVCSICLYILLLRVIRTSRKPPLSCLNTYGT